MTYSTLWLSQIQFFSSLGFMLMFLALELGLAWMLAYFRVRSLLASPAPYTGAYRFWVRIFALAFILSFAASLPVLIQLGSLWPGLMAKIGDVAGPLLAAGILSVFIFKSCFLGAMLFGERRLAPKVHAVVVCMVALGATVMAFWLLVLVSWSHVPVGAELVNDAYRVTDWVRVIFNPALPWYAALFLLGSALTSAFLVMGVVAAQALRTPCDESSQVAFRFAVKVAAVCIVLQAVALGGAGQVTAQYQPAKAAAAAAYWHSGADSEIVLFAWPDTDHAANRSAWVWSGAGDAWLGRDAHGKLRGLDQFGGMSPPVPAIFWSFRLAALAGLLMGVVAWITLWRARRVGYSASALSRLWRRVLVGMGCSGWVMLIAGLVYVLLGAYPYAVNGTITVSEIAGDTSFTVLAISYVAYMLFYGLFFVGFFAMLRHVSRYGVVPVARHRGRA
ncbi:cytochrome ubiquinol oxidase subunit I [Allopusillimonas ginsengisoli]|uniref:cytochrome ubiquinol oxidase subunit I n=1 Tax=Allopusillimonas ginsengisoli TaxID=453575 RepID=UPI0010C1A4EC|nr:cytochrome ubiquinol oxidase subunit I [Allopusillimonas ginsengisoli]